MKNNSDEYQAIQTARQSQVHAVNTDGLVNPQVIAQNYAKMNHRTRKKRRINYEKKILNDPDIFNV